MILSSDEIFAQACALNKTAKEQLKPKEEKMYVSKVLRSFNSIGIITRSKARFQKEN